MLFSHRPVTLLLDNGIFSHAEFAESAVKKEPIAWGDTFVSPEIVGLKRKQPHRDPEHQKQIDALFTVGRLIREETIIPYTYSELSIERGQSRIQNYNALRNCSQKLKRCVPALERSKFRQTVNLEDYFAKGGKKDKKAGINLGDANQLAFMSWLFELPDEAIAGLVKHSTALNFSAFEVESLKNIGWFKFVCSKANSAENYPDVFHLWTAERNNLDGFLTLDTTFINIISSLEREKTKSVAIKTKLIRPLELLHGLGIEEPDAVPMQYDQFYYRF